MEQSKGLDGGTLKANCSGADAHGPCGSDPAAGDAGNLAVHRAAGVSHFHVFYRRGLRPYPETLGDICGGMAIWAAVSEIPFNLEIGARFRTWRGKMCCSTFCLALLTLRGLDRHWAGSPGLSDAAQAAALALAAGFAAGELLQDRLRRLGRGDRGAAAALPGGQICEAVACSWPWLAVNGLGMGSRTSAGFRHGGAYTDFRGGGAAGDLAV